MDANLTGQVTIVARADSRIQMICVSMEAPSLTSKADDIKIGGHTYIGGNPAPQGAYDYKTYNYDSVKKGFVVDIKYAQAVLCEIPNANVVIPTK